MTLEELKKIREEQSLEAAHLTGAALREYFEKDAREFHAAIEAKRKEKGIVVEQKKIYR
jgi:hypothetical protein